MLTLQSQAIILIRNNKILNVLVNNNTSEVRSCLSSGAVIEFNSLYNLHLLVSNGSQAVDSKSVDVVFCIGPIFQARPLSLPSAEQGVSEGNRVLTSHPSLLQASLAFVSFAQTC